MAKDRVGLAESKVGVVLEGPTGVRIESADLSKCRDPQKRWSSHEVVTEQRVRRDRGELEDRGEDIRAGFVGEDDVVLDRGVIEQREERGGPGLVTTRGVAQEDPGGRRCRERLIGRVDGDRRRLLFVDDDGRHVLGGDLVGSEVDESNGRLR